MANKKTQKSTIKDAVELLLKGMRVLETIDSPYNGKIEVIQMISYGTIVKIGGLTQSGGVVKDVWKTSLKKVHGKKIEIENCLILGLGAGSNAELVNQYWPAAKITGVDIDPLMIKLGKKYLKLDTLDVNSKVADAYSFIQKNKKKYDLILVDLYKGDTYPAKFEKDEFLEAIQNSLSEEGIVVFNRLYYGEKRPDAARFGRRLEKLYSKVDVVYPEANVMFLCRK